MNISSGSGSELIQIADAVAKEKLIDPKLVIDAMEESLAKAAKSKYGQEYDIRADIDSRSGTVSMSRWRKVVEKVENHFTEINESDFKMLNILELKSSLSEAISDQLSGQALSLRIQVNL